MAELSNKVLVVLHCPECNKKYKLRALPEDLDNFKNGMPANLAFPYVDYEIKELLNLGCCPECWDKRFIRFSE